MPSNPTVDATAFQLIPVVADDADRPSLALEAYCELSEDWANAVLQGGDLSQVYPVKAEPTIEHAKMLLSRVSFIREKIIPDVE
jgi:hypothetical protein